MATYNNNSYQDPRNINLKGGVSGSGLIRWGQTGAANWGSNPFSATEVGIYVSAAGKLTYSYLGATIDLGNTGTLVNPMTAVGDIIIGGTAGAPTKLVKGTANQILAMKSDGSTLEWIANSDVGFANPMTAVGDLIIGAVAGAPTVFAKGTAGQILHVKADGTTLEWTSGVASFGPAAVASITVTNGIVTAIS